MLKMDIMVNLLKIKEYQKEKELMQYLELILEKHIYVFYDKVFTVLL
jgi:hypothetical protein